MRGSKKGSLRVLEDLGFRDAQRLPDPLTKAYSLNHIRNPTIIEGIWLS